MSISKPYHRFFRKALPGNNQGYNSTAYLSDHSYADRPEMYIRSFDMIQQDVRNLFEYIEPDDQNLATYSMKIYDLYVRICLEVEANFKAIFRENKYSKNSKDWTVKDYFKINRTHHLSGYKITFPIWRGEKATFTPFSEWDSKEYKPLDWYQIYNNCKHNRYEHMPKANFGNMLNAFAGLFALLSSQFGLETYSPGSILLSVAIGDDSYYQGEFGIGDYLQVQFPNDWTEDELYGFSWSELKTQEERFQKYDYDA